MISTDRKRVGSLLVEVALSNRTQSSRAVLQAVLALSAFHHGEHATQVDKFQRRALRGLYTHVAPNLCEGVEHIAANLLLCVLAMQQTSDRNSAWVGYINGIKNVIDGVKGGRPCPGSDVSIILDWVYYFEVMARFSFRHWRTENIKAVAEELGFKSDGSSVCQLQYLLTQASFLRGLPNIAVHAHPVVQLLAEVSGTIMYSSDPRYFSAEYQEHLNILRSSLENVSSDTVATDGVSTGVVGNTDHILEVTRLAGLIYLERVSRNFSGQSAKIESWTKAALSMIQTLESCLCPFALFVVSCEVNADEDRLIILDLYAKMESRSHLPSLLEVKALIQTAWIQQDLEVDGELQYIHKLNLVMSSREVIPSFI
jgi:hypothetical protein